MEFKPKNQWKVNNSITRGRSGAGQIRWKGPGEQPGTDRFLVIVERNRGKPDYIKKSESIEGTKNDAVKLMTRLASEVDTALTPPAVEQDLVKSVEHDLELDEQADVQTRLARLEKGQALNRTLLIGLLGTSLLALLWPKRKKKRKPLSYL